MLRDEGGGGVATEPPVLTRGIRVQRTLTLEEYKHSASVQPLL